MFCGQTNVLSKWNIASIESINVVNAIGQVVRTTKDKQFSIADLPKGVYIVVVKTSKGFVSEKVLSPMKWLGIIDEAVSVTSDTASPYYWCQP